MPEAALKRRVNEARRAGILTLADVADVTSRFPLYPGAKALQSLLEVKGGPTRSEWEDAFPAWCRRHQLPRPVMSAIVAGYEVDALFPEEKVIIELDSWEFHQGRDSFESDRERDAATLAAGFVTVRITWGRMTAGEAARLHAILESRRQRPG
jgi:very-short-patch-repair endonuclease